jgi:hypothetical protein
MKRLNLSATHAKTNGTSPKPILFICDFFPKDQSSQHIGHDVKPPLKGLGC